MRFLQLDLRAFGPFADPPPLDLSGGDRGLHLILGPNEAGKSTTLRAIRHLLFGFPARTRDGHLTPNEKLRISAILRDESGEEVGFTRRKKIADSLWTFEDDKLIAPDALRTCLGTLDESRFAELFSMDHDELVAGGRAIVEGKGSLGTILFAAGTGLARVDEVRKALDAEVDALFKPAGKLPPINVALAEWKTARDGAERQMLATSSWVDLDRELAEGRASKSAVDAEIRRAVEDRRRLERARDALPVIAGLGRSRDRLAAIGPAPALAEGFAERRREATLARQLALKAIEDTDEALGAEALARDALGPRDPALDEAEPIGRALLDLALYRQALRDRPVDQSKLAQAEARALALLGELLPGGPDADAPPPGRAPAPLVERIQRLADERNALDERRSAAMAELSGLARPVEGEAPAPPADLRAVEVLGQAIARAKARGDLEALLAADQLEVARLEASAEIELLKLPLWSGTLEALETLAIPLDETLGQFEAEFRDRSEALARASAESDRLEAEAAELALAIARGEESGPVPSEGDLGALRAERDALWRVVRRAWLEGPQVVEPAQLAEGFESSVRRADDLADRLRHEADAVALQANRRWKGRELADRLARANAGRDRASAELDALRDAWRGAWAPLGIEPRTPREMKDWVKNGRAPLIRQAQALRDRKLDFLRKAATIEAFRAEIGRHLVEVGEPEPGPLGSLAATIDLGLAAIERARAGAKLEAARAGLARAEVARLDWQGRWAGAVKPLGLTGDASPTIARDVIDWLDELATLRQESEELRASIADHARLEARFEAEVGDLARRLGVEAPGEDAEAVARRLDETLKRAVVAETRREEIAKRQAREAERREGAAEALGRADAVLAALAIEAGCEGPEGLIEAERRSEAVAELRREARGLEDQLLTLAGPVGVDRLVEEAEGMDPAGLEARIAEISARIEPLEAESGRLGEANGGLAEQLLQMDGGPGAAEARQIVEEKAARLALDVERYARLRLAAAVLREAVERHRKEHQGPVLERAGALFAALTAGSFAGLAVGADDKGQPTLLGLRAGSPATIGVEGMSEGTADQLYLALRLASLMTHLDHHEPMPMVLDDLLVNFDDARAVAALKALADLSRRTQVLFFTHHAHLVDLARKALPEGVLFVHHLSFPPTSLPRPEAEPGPTRRKKAKKVEATEPAG